jgi:hypothetical protein
MGKKSRRARAKHRAGGKLAKRVPAQRIHPSEPKLEFKAATPSIRPAFSSAQATRYQYVLPELRRIGIIAGVLFLILIILAFVLG